MIPFKYVIDISNHPNISLNETFEAFPLENIVEFKAEKISREEVIYL